MSRAKTGSRRALGRGLDSLIPAPESAGGKGKGDYFLCPIEKVIPRKGQPRQRFDDDALDELAQSIREQGIIQPLVVRRVPKGYEIIAGERRWRAAQRAALRDVPVVVQDVSPSKALEMALVENLQREDLNPIERAEAYQQLVDEHGLKHDQLAKRLGKARSTIANALRILALPQDVQALVEEGVLSEGHGRALLAAGDGRTISALAKRVAKQGLSVRQTERLAKSTAAQTEGKPATKSAPASAQIRHIEKKLRDKLGCAVKLKDRDGRGHRGVLELKYTSAEELDRLLDSLLGGDF